jgi:hypothetical protein
MTVSLPVFLPNEQQTFVVKFMENLFQPLERQIPPYRRNTSPDDPQVRQLETP